MAYNTTNGKKRSLYDELFYAMKQMLVLMLLNQRPMYIYEISKELARLSDGTVALPPLYALAVAMEQKGLVHALDYEIADNRARRRYEITDEGRAALQQYAREYAAFVSRADSMLAPFGLGRTSAPQ